MNRDHITVQECLNKHNRKGLAVVLENGKVAGFVPENKRTSPRSDSSSGDR